MNKIAVKTVLELSTDAKAGEFLPTHVWQAISNDAQFQSPFPVTFRILWPAGPLVDGEKVTLHDLPHDAQFWRVESVNKQYSSVASSILVVVSLTSTHTHHPRPPLTLGLLLALAEMGAAMEGCETTVTDALQKAHLPTTWAEWQQRLGQTP